MSGLHIIDDRARDISPDVLDEQGRLRILPAEYWRTTTAAERALLCVRRALYCIPTVELVARLRELIGSRKAIEIGSGNGVLAAALGIPATDNRMQEMPRYRQVYESMGQPTITYGANVDPYDAHAAVRLYRPQVVVAAWVTHKYERLRHEAGGNEIGVDEDRIIDSVESYIVIGNRGVHAGKKIWGRPHTIEHPDYLYSRAMNGLPDFIAEWKRE